MAFTVHGKKYFVSLSSGEFGLCADMSYAGEN